jgi:hypothetical protein
LGILRAGLFQRRTETQISLIRKDRRRKGLRNQRSNQQYLAEPQQSRFHGIPSSRKTPNTAGNCEFSRMIGGNL